MTLEVIHEQAHGLEQLGEALSGHQPREAFVANQAPDDGAMLLLNPGLVILLVGTRARELQLRIACLRWHLATATNSSRILAFSCLEASW